MRIVAVVGLLLSGLLFAPPCFAQSKKDWAECSGNEPDKGIPACTRIINRKKETRNDLSIAYFNRGNYRQTKTQYDEALADFEESIRLNPKDPDAQNAKGDALWNKSAFDDAIAAYTQAIAMSPKKAEFYKDRGDAYVSKSDYDKAIADYTVAIGLGKPSSDLYNDRGNAYAQKAEVDNAFADFDKAISIDPTSAIAHANRGWAYQQKHDLDRALGDYAEAIRLDPETPDNFSGRAWVLYDRREFTRSRADFEEAIRLAPENANYRQGRGAVYREAGEPDKALADLSEAVRLAPQDSNNYISRASAYDDKKAFDLAIADYDKAIELDKNSGGAFNGRCWAKAQKGDIASAIPDCDRGIELLPTDPNVWHTRAWAHTRRGSLANALADFEKAVQLDPEMAGIFADRGYAYELTGNREQALADYQKALTLKTKQKYDDEAKAEALKRLTSLAARAPERDEPQKEPVKDVDPREPDKRIALVIGNSAYRNTSPLKNPENDSRAIAATFRRLGFDEVVEKHDLTFADLSAELKNFGDRAESADWAVVYYAGHGIEVGGINYLVPVDAALKASTHVDDEAVPLQRVLAKVELARKMRLVILDACRDNPFAAQMAQAGGSRSVGRGLARVEPDPGVLVAYAARDGQVAADGGGEDNSPYAATFCSAASAVRKATNGKQVPFTYGSLPEEEMYFKTR